MIESFKDVDERGQCKEDLGSRLNRHPHLKARMEGLLAIIDNAGEDIEKSSAAEQRVMEELRKMENEALHCWAENQERKKAEELEKSDMRLLRKQEKSTVLIFTLASDLGLYYDQPR